MTTYTILAQQSLFDIAVQVYGHVDGVFWLLEDNDGLGLTDRLQVGQVLTIRDEQINAQQADALTDFGPFQTIDQDDFPEGIGYWYVDEYTVS